MLIKGIQVGDTKTKAQNKAKTAKLIILKPDILHSYLRHSEINHYLEYVSHRYPSFVTLHLLGMTYEQRPLMAVEIDWCCSKNLNDLTNRPYGQYGTRSSKLDGCVTKRAKNPLHAHTRAQHDYENRRNFILIEGGTHAREWLSISVALHCIHQLTEKNIRHREMLEKLRFFIVPVVNPDGYDYTLRKNRRWRKNRRPIENSKCIGVDCNRNYDVHWENGATLAHRCTFRGETPFSDAETRAMRTVLKTLAPNLLFFLSLHSHAQSIMYPYGFSRELPHNWAVLEKLAIAGRNAIKKHSGREYRCGNISKVTNRLIPGSIVDYAYAVIKAPLALVMELPSAEFGFHPPLELIQTLGNESWVGIREMCKCAIELAPEVAPRLSASVELLVSDDEPEREESVLSSAYALTPSLIMSLKKVCE